MNNHHSFQLAITDVLILVDVQNDFLPGGNLAVPDGDQVVPVLNRYLSLFQQKQLPIFATRDWHPTDHCSFKDNGGIWPIHCVQRSNGAEFAADLSMPDYTVIISKGDTSTLDSYSGFNHTSLTKQLHELGCCRLFIGGLATDYCVLNTVLDAINLGFKVMLLEDAIRAVNLNSEDGDRAIARMKEAGATGICMEMLDNVIV